MKSSTICGPVQIGRHKHCFRVTRLSDCVLCKEQLFHIRKERQAVRPVASTVCRAVAEAAQETKQGPQPVQEGKWHAVIASADFMLHDVQNESFAEQLRERRRLYSEKGKALDFWLVAEPAWLDKAFPEKAKKVKRPSVALVSTDEVWINFMKLRLDRVLRLELDSCNLDEVTESKGPLPEYQPLDRDIQWTAPYPPYRPGWPGVTSKQAEDGSASGALSSIQLNRRPLKPMTTSGEATGSRGQIGRQTSLLGLLIGRFFRFQKASSGTGAQGPEQDLEQAQELSLDHGSGGQLSRSQDRIADLPLNFAGDQAVPHGIAHSPSDDLGPTETSPDQTLSAAGTNPSADTSDSDWNFSRRSGRSQRSAREWQRGSTLNLSDWDNLQPSHSQQSDAVSPDNLQDNADSKDAAECTPIQGRPAQKCSVRSRPLQRRYFTRGRVSREASVEPSAESTELSETNTHKRKSLEAGLPDPSRHSADKIGRTAEDPTAVLSDFYPVELRDRSVLFNS